MNLLVMGWLLDTERLQQLQQVFHRGQMPFLSPNQQCLVLALQKSVANLLTQTLTHLLTAHDPHTAEPASCRSMLLLVNQWNRESTCHRQGRGPRSHSTPPSDAVAALQHHHTHTDTARPSACRQTSPANVQCK